MHPPTADQRIANLARRQHGIVALTQLRAAGITDRAVEWRLRAGRLHRVHRGVYAVGHTAVTEKGRLLAAVLACGRGAALSHRSAGRLWRFVRHAPEIEVTARRTRAARGIVLHRAPLTAPDRTVLDRIPVATPARTLVDLADVLTQRQLSAAVNEAEVRRLFDLGEVAAATGRAGARRGRAKLQRALAAWRPQQFTRSEAERRFLELCERHALPRPRVNAWIDDMEVDFFWPAHDLVVETDGAATHLTRRSFVEDRRRDRALVARGLRVMRVAWDDLHAGGEELAAQLITVMRPRP